MKKLLTTIPLFAASLVFSADYTAGGSFLDTAFQDIVNNYDSVSTKPITLQYSSHEKKVATFSKDFTFNSTIYLDSRKEYGNGSAVVLYSENGSKLTFNCNAAKPASSLSGVKFGLMGTTSKHIEAVFTQNFTQEIWLKYANITFKSADGVALKASSYIHLNYNCVITADNTDLTIGTAYTRYKSDVQSDGRSYVATFVAKNADIVINNFLVNGSNATAGSFMKIVYGTDNAEAFKVIGAFSALTDTTDPQNFILEDMGINDTFSSKYDLCSDTYKDRIFVEYQNKEYHLYELVENDIIKTSTADGFYTYTMTIPEPSTYAMIFGTLALGFALYRKRK